jgi:hypothetical protein
MHKCTTNVTGQVHLQKHPCTAALEQRKQTWKLGSTCKAHNGSYHPQAQAAQGVIKLLNTHNSSLEQPKPNWNQTHSVQDHISN